MRQELPSSCWEKKAPWELEERALCSCPCSCHHPLLTLCGLRGNFGFLVSKLSSAALYTHDLPVRIRALPETRKHCITLCWFFCLVTLMSDSFVTPRTVAHQAMGFPRQEYWAGLLFPSSRGSS